MQKDYQAQTGSTYPSNSHFGYHFMCISIKYVSLLLLPIRHHFHCIADMAWRINTDSLLNEIFIRIFQTQENN